MTRDVLGLHGQRNPMTCTLIAWMSNHEKEGTSTLTHPAHGLLDGEREYCLQNWKMVLSLLVSIDFNESA